MRLIRKDYMVSPDHVKKLKSRAAQKKASAKSASELLRKAIDLYFLRMK